jgi:N-acyl-L-homoserine lactone synthetase
MAVRSGVAAELSESMRTRIACYRYRVFVERLGWGLKTDGGAELDQFDRADTVYLVAQANDARICGCARLLPTTRPYLLAEVFPELCGGRPPPCSPEVWELSRFAAVDFASRVPPAAQRFSSPVAIALLQAALASAAARGAKWLISVSPAGIERLLRRAGFRAHRAASARLVDGQPLIACWIETVAAGRAVRH